MRGRSLICGAAVVLTALLPGGRARAADRGEPPGLAIAERQEVRDVIAFGESVEVAGTVTDAIIAIASDVRLTPTARVGGDVYVLGGMFTPSPGARLDGSVTVVSPAFLHVPAVVRRHLALIAISLLVARVAFMLVVWILAWHLAPTEFADRQAHRLAERPVRVLGLGLLWAVLLGVGGIVASLTMIGLPLALSFLLLLGSAGVVGLAVTIRWLRDPGRFSVRGRRIVVASLVVAGLVPLIGESLLYGVAPIGLGVALCAFAEARGVRRAVFESSR